MPTVEAREVTITIEPVTRQVTVEATAGVTAAYVASAIAASSHTPEGTAIKSTGEGGGSKYLREDGDGTCSWQPVTAPAWGNISGTLSSQTDLQAALDAKQAASTPLTDIAALAATDGNIIVGNGSTWVAENGATARTSLGLGTGDSPTFLAQTLTGQSLTGSQATSLLDLATTWNTTGTPTALKLNVTDTASNAGSLLMDLQFDGVPRFRIGKSNVLLSRSAAGGVFLNLRGFAGGGVTFGYGTDFLITGSAAQTTGVRLDSGGNPFYFASGPSVTLAVDPANAAYKLGSSGTMDVSITRDAAAILALRNSTNAQTFRVYGTYTDASNYVRASLSSNGTSSVTLAAETAGTGADDIDLVLTPVGTGVVNACGAAISVKATGKLSMGITNIANATYSTAIGRSCSAYGYNSLAMGNDSYCNNGYSVAVGISCFHGIATSASEYSVAVGYDCRTDADNITLLGQRLRGTVAKVCEIGYWSSTTVRVSAIRLQNASASFTLPNTATALTDGGATAGSEANGTLGREMFSLRRDGDELLVDVNVAGTVKTLSLGTAT